MSRRQTLVLLSILALAVSVAPASAKTLTSHTEKSFPAEPGGKVSVDVSFHDVVVKVAPVSEVSFVVDLEVRGSASKAQEMLDELEPQFNHRDSVIALKSTRRSNWSFSFFGGHEAEGRVRVTMPPDMHLVVDTASGDCEVDGDLGQGRLAVDVASGEVVIRGAAAEILVDSASGDVELSLAREVASVIVDTASGDVVVKGAVRELRADTASGDVVASGLLGSASFDTASGEVKARWEAIDSGSKIVADTSSGDVRLSLPATVVGGTLSTSSGTIVSAFPGQSRDRDRVYRLDGGDGAVRVLVDTASGDISLIED